MPDRFELVTDFEPKGDQPQAIGELVDGLRDGTRHQVLMGVTGSGKTFTVANVIAEVNRPTAVLAPNKTLAAQLYAEFRDLFPSNAVEYFVSYYDYYQPEAYIPRTDTYIEKDASINDEIDKMRHSATRSVLSRRDVIVVASVSCIYGIGSPETYKQMMVALNEGESIERDEILRGLVAMQYERNDLDFHRGTFRVRGDVIEVFPAYETETAVRIELFGDYIDQLSVIDPLRGRQLRKMSHVEIFPSSHYVTGHDNLRRAVVAIEHELAEHVKNLNAAGKLVEAQRLDQRTKYDLEMLNELGYCSGIENYSRHIDNRMPGEPAHVLLDYFPDDFLMFIDESHVAVPQIRGMSRGDRARKESLVNFGFRLPSAVDNRPLRFDEFETHVGQTIYVSATPGAYELEKTDGLVIEQIIRPTGLTDPKVEVKPATHQVDDLLEEIRIRVEKEERVLVTTLTKRMAEDLTEYYTKMDVRCRYLHADIKTLERIEIVRDLRRGEFDVLIGINLLREGLDIPEVSLVAILDADKEGYLRNVTSLVQTFGRAARNVDGTVIMYGDKVTGSMQAAITETDRRREIQKEYNREHGITPETITKQIHDLVGSIYEAGDYVSVPKVAEDSALYATNADRVRHIKLLRRKMKQAANELEFEKAAELRDRIRAIEEQNLIKT
jgi:excinuclease ABC subunit B